MKRLRIEERSIAERVDIRGAPSIKYFPSGAMIALREKQVKMTQVYISAEMTSEGSMSQTASIKGPVLIPEIKPKDKQSEHVRTRITWEYQRNVRLVAQNILLPEQSANPLRYMNLVPSSFPSVFLENANIHIKTTDPIALNNPPSKYPVKRKKYSCD